MAAAARHCNDAASRGSPVATVKDGVNCTRGYSTCTGEREHCERRVSFAEGLSVYYTVHSFNRTNKMGNGAKSLHYTLVAGSVYVCERADAT